MEDAIAPRKTSSPPERTSSLSKHEICLIFLFANQGHDMTHRAQDFFSVIFMFDVRVSALGDTSRKASHVPYRDSKLTRLLQVSKSQLFNGTLLFVVSDAC
jgi:hypothetical protein